MDDTQLIDVLLNRHDVDLVLSSVSERDRARKRAALVVGSLPPGVPQRTPEWYKIRKGMLTASEFKMASGPDINHSYVMGKVFPTPFPSNDAMTWGCRFEDLACATYEHEHGSKVLEYGLLVHPVDTFLGASPDGITPYGVAVEIKCPYSRKRVEIDRRVETNRPFPKNDRENLKSRYLPQVQGQLEVVDLELCDFVVAHIDELEENAFWQLRRVSDARHRYAIVVDVIDGSGSTKYLTAPVHLSEEALHAWLCEVTSKNTDVVVWHAHVRELGVTRIRRDREYWTKLREGLGRTKNAIDAVFRDAEHRECAPPGGPCPLFSEDPGV